MSEKKDEKEPKQPPAPVKSNDEALSEEQLGRISGGALDAVKKDSPTRI